MGINIINYALAKKHSGSGVSSYDDLQDTPIKQIGFHGMVTDITTLPSGLYRIIGDYSVGNEIIKDENNNSLIQISKENKSIIVNDPDFGIKTYIFDGIEWIREDVEHQTDPVNEQEILDLFKK